MFKKKKNKFKMFDEERNNHLEDLLESFTFKYTSDELVYPSQRMIIYKDLMKETIEIASRHYEEKIDKITDSYRIPGGLFSSMKITHDSNSDDYERVFDEIKKRNSTDI